MSTHAAPAAPAPTQEGRRPRRRLGRRALRDRLRPLIGGALAVLVATGTLVATSPDLRERAQAIFVDAPSLRSTFTIPSFGRIQLTYNMAAPGCNRANPVTLPTKGTVAGYVDWGDGSGQDLTPGATHVFPAATTYTVRVSGTFTSLNSSAGNASCLVSVDEWTEGTGTTTAASGFAYSANLTSVARLPSTVTDTSNMFFNAAKFNGAIGSWDTSNVTNMSTMFQNAIAFNQPLNGWNTAKVTNMNSMFALARAFNQPLSSWNTSSVTNMGLMFNGATVFNGAVGTWDTTKVTVMSGAFQNAAAFNQPLTAWNTANVLDFSNVFNGAKAFNQPLAWNTIKATTMAGTFQGATAFNQPLAWNTAKVTTMNSMFLNSNMSSNISAWVVTQRPTYANFTTKTVAEWPTASRPKFLN